MSKFTVTLVVHGIEASSPQSAALIFRDTLEGTELVVDVADEQNKTTQLHINPRFYEE